MALLATLWSLLALGTVGCGPPFEPASVCVTPKATFYLHSGVTRTCAYYSTAMKSAASWDEANGYLTGAQLPSRLQVYVWNTEVFDGNYEGLTHLGSERVVELGQDARAMAHELLHVALGLPHHEGWEVLGAPNQLDIAYAFISPDTGKILEVARWSYWDGTRQWMSEWMGQPPGATTSGGKF